MTLAIAAAVVLGLAAGLETWAVLTLGWRRALELSDVPDDPALPKLVFAGPFRIVRHPQSLGLLLVLLAAALAFASPAMWLLAVVAGGLVVAMALRDDREMAKQFGGTVGLPRAGQRRHHQEQRRKDHGTRGFPGTQIEPD